MHQVTLSPVLESISHRHRLLHGLALHIYLITVDPCLSRVEYLIFSGYLEEIAGGAVLEVYPFLTAGEGDDSGIILEGDIAIGSKLRQTFDAVGMGEGQDSQTLTGFFLLSRMNTILQTGIHQYCHTGIVDHRLHLQLLFAQEGTVILPVDERVVVWCYLTVVEGEVTLLPVGTPTFDHIAQHPCVRLITGNVILTLVPDDTTHRITEQWVEHTVV